MSAIHKCKSWVIFMQTHRVLVVWLGKSGNETEEARFLTAASVKAFNSYHSKFTMTRSKLPFTDPRLFADSGSGILPLDRDFPLHSDDKCNVAYSSSEAFC